MPRIDTMIRDISRTIEEIARRVRRLETQVTSQSPSICINVKDYGARGDGVTDDSAAIQAAIDSVGATTYYCNMKLCFPVGIYLCGTSINMTDKCNIIIEGAGGGVSGTSTTRILGTTSGKPVFDLSGSANISMRDIQIQGNNTSTPSCGILLARTTAPNGENAAWNTFYNVDVQGYFTVCAVYSWSTDTHAWTKCTFQNLSTSGKCALFLGGRNRYSITSDYVTFSATVGSTVNKFTDCFYSLYNATAPDAIIVLGDGAGGSEFNGGYAQSNLACPSVEIQGTNYTPWFVNWYTEHTNPTAHVYFTLYSGGGVAYDVRIVGGSHSVLATYLIDQVASHTITGLVVDQIGASVGGASNLRFAGIVSYARLLTWWASVSGTVSFNELYYSEVNYSYHTVTITTGIGNDLIDHSATDKTRWLMGKALKIGANSEAALLASITSVITASAAYDPPSLADGAAAVTYVSLTGVLADGTWIAMASHTNISSLDKWVISAFPAAGSVVVTIVNHTGGAVDLGSGTLRVVAMKVA